MENVKPYIEKEEFTVESVQTTIREEEAEKQKAREPLKDQTDQLKEKI